MLVVDTFATIFTPHEQIERYNKRISKYEKCRVQLSEITQKIFRLNYDDM